MDQDWWHVYVPHREAVTAVRCSFSLTVCLSGDILLSRFRSDSKRKTLATSYCTGHLLQAVLRQEMIIKRGEQIKCVCVYVCVCVCGGLRESKCKDEAFNCSQGGTPFNSLKSYWRKKMEKELCFFCEAVYTLTEEVKLKRMARHNKLQ